MQACQSVGHFGQPFFGENGKRILKHFSEKPFYREDGIRI